MKSFEAGDSYMELPSGEAGDSYMELPSGEAGYTSTKIRRKSEVQEIP